MENQSLLIARPLRMNRAKIVAKELDVGLANGVESCRMTGSIWEVNHRIIWYGMSTLLIEERSGEKRRVATFRASAERDEGRRHCDSPLCIVRGSPAPHNATTPQCSAVPRPPALNTYFAPPSQRVCRESHSNRIQSEFDTREHASDLRSSPM